MSEAQDPIAIRIERLTVKYRGKAAVKGLLRPAAPGRACKFSLPFCARLMLNTPPFVLTLRLAAMS